MAAGMTGGLGYFYDEEGDFEDKVRTSTTMGATALSTAIDC